jgi:hypothetical protein
MVRVNVISSDTALMEKLDARLPNKYSLKRMSSAQIKSFLEKKQKG